MKLKKVLSVLLSSAMLLSSTGVVLAEDTLVGKIAASENGAAIAVLLDSDTSGELGLDLTDYSKLKYRDYVGEMIYNAPHSTAEEIQAAFTAAMAEAVTKTSIDQFSIGAVLNTTGANGGNNNADKDGLQFKTGIIRTGNYAGITGFVIYDEIENPSLIMELTADITASNADRAFNISEYTTEGVPSTIVDRSGTKQYDSSTAEYTAFVNYVDRFTVLEAPVTVSVDADKKATGVDLSALLPSLNAISNSTTPLVLRFTGATKNQAVNNMALNITYDNTIAMYNADMAANNTFNKVYEVKDNAEQLKAVIESLSSEELAVLDVDLTKYNTLKYPSYAINAVVEAGFENAAGFKSAFDMAVDSMFEVVEVANYDLGANLITDATGYSDASAYPGLEIKTTQVFNGFKGEGFEGYVWYNSIENPSAIVDMTAVVTGHNTGTATNDRKTWINGYSTVLPQYRENKIANNSSNMVNNVDYAQGSAEYNSWVEYSTTLEEYIPEAFTFANETNISNEVNLSGIADALEKITTDSTPLVIRFQKLGGNSANQRVNGLKLTITYDKTVELYNEEQLILNSFKKIYDAKNDAEALDEVLSTLTSDEVEIVGIDTKVYNKLANSLVAAEALSEAEWETSEEFAEVFNTVVSGLTEVKTVSFDVGAVVSTDSANTSDQYGLQFKSGYIRNGKTSGVTGYTMYYSVEDPYAVMDMSANVTGYNTPTATNNRNIHITGYSTSALTSFVDESDIIIDSKNYVYEPNTEIYNAFDEYAQSFAALDDEIIVEFAATDVNAENQAYKEGVDFNVIAEAIKNINKATTPLAFKFSDATQSNSIKAVDLVITYDKTAVSKFDEGVLADINSILDSTADAEVLSVGNEYASKLLGDSYSLYAELANSVRVSFIRELALAQCETIEAMSEKAVELINALEDVAIKYTVEAIDTANKCITIKKNTNFTGNYELILASYDGNALATIKLIDNVEEDKAVLTDYRNVRYGADGETFKLYYGDVDLSNAQSVKVMILNNLEEIIPMAEVFVK